jgi:superfamily II DNA or RNA helicase
VLTKNLKHAETLRKLIPGSYKLEGKDSLEDRESVLKSFTDSAETEIMIGTIIFQTGVDIPELTHLINARGLKSEIATIQALGRTLRKHENKNKVFIYDFIDKVPYLAKHSRSRISAYKSLNFELEFHGKAFGQRKKD